ncbi:ABC-type transport auxiliary lipoprotein family protein [Nitrosovibrio sp. Nv4]|uniref:ABC-type transport auxiliary lipoprotein family protein n=1 Tax=Nitrosovibrio sp. Nv4 TaxID=1945880 RepID=UPI000BD66517|nr:ABC-type transport auxiliary lipoprotein family protein [Nitrosovibrio sp. Nv4]SOD42270.1 cholesterol transport system auxiliary component [Nitrosovibrio sp. Nv4]
MRKLLVLALMALAGCVTPRAQTPIAVYDFGLQRLATASNAETSGNRRLKASLFVADAAAPGWLDSTAIHYRLAYHDLAQSHAYANNRWAATPAILLTQRIRSRIAEINDGAVVSAADGARADYMLRLELEEFTQVFDTVDQSRAVIKFRASLVESGTRLLLAQRSFSMEQAAPAANAQGAVRALTEASDKLIGNLIGWLINELPRENQNPGMAQTISDEYQ